MTNLVDLGFHRFEKLSAGYAETLRHELVLIQAIDISKLNGRELRKLRDRLLRIKWLLVVCDPKTREQIANRMGDVTPSTTLEELAKVCSGAIYGEVHLRTGRRGFGPEKIRRRARNVLSRRRPVSNWALKSPAAKVEQ
jgi:hypothetical protein